jgi:hypothetical protein
MKMPNEGLTEEIVPNEGLKLNNFAKFERALGPFEMLFGGS